MIHIPLLDLWWKPEKKRIMTVKEGVMKNIWILVVSGLILFFFISIGIIYNIYTSNLSPEDIAYEYDQFEHVEDYKEIDTLPEDFFVVYIYSNTGEDSEEVKSDLCQFALSNEENIKVYFSEYPLTSIPRSIGSPALLIVDNNEVTTTYQGIPGVYGFLDDVSSGLYP